MTYLSRKKTSLILLVGGICRREDDCACVGLPQAIYLDKTAHHRNDCACTLTSCGDDAILPESGVWKSATNITQAELIHGWRNFYLPNGREFLCRVPLCLEVLQYAL